MIALKGYYECGSLRFLEPISKDITRARLTIIVEPDDFSEFIIENSEYDSNAMMSMQADSGFAKNILGDPAEDVWNSLKPINGIPQDF